MFIPSKRRSSAVDRRREQEVALGKARNCQHDPRHVDMLVKDLGLEHANPVLTPATPDVMKEEKSEPLSQVQHQQYRSQVARCLFLSQDRSDITFIVNDLCQKMLSPNHQSLARYLKRERQWGQVFENGNWLKN